MAFPKTQSHADLTVGAPAPVTERQLEELHIRVVDAGTAEANGREMKGS